MLNLSDDEKIPGMGKWCWKYEYCGNNNLNACGWQMHTWCIHVHVIYIYYAPIVLHGGRKGTVEHLVWDEVAIAWEVGSIFIWEILLKLSNFACIDWWLESRGDW